MKVLVVINPSSGEDEPILALLNRFFKKNDIDWETLITSESKPLEIDKSFDVVVVYGGDGTISDVVSCIERQPMLCLHGGTGNVIADKLSIPKDHNKALQLLLEPSMVKLDLIDVNGKKSLLGVTAGDITAAISKVSREKKDADGSMAYIKSALSKITKIDSHSIKITTENDVLNTDFKSLIVANIPYPHIEKLTTSDIDPTDGFLDLILINEIDVATALNILAKKINLKNNNIQSKRVKKIKLESEKTLWSIDDEFVEQKEINIKISDNKIKMIVGNSCQYL